MMAERKHPAGPPMTLGNMRYQGVLIPVLCWFLCACANQQLEETMKAASKAANECMLREGPQIASTKTDLETASIALLARCNAEISAERRAFIDEYPGTRRLGSPQVKEWDAMRVDLARKTIAVLRTKTAQP